MLKSPCNSCNYAKYVHMGVKFSRHWEEETLRSAEWKQKNLTLVSVTKHDLPIVTGQQYLIKGRLLYTSTQEARLPQDINGSNCTVYTESTKYMQLCCFYNSIGCSSHKHEQTALTTSHRLTVSVTISFTFSRKLWVGFP